MDAFALLRSQSQATSKKKHGPSSSSKAPRKRARSSSSSPSARSPARQGSRFVECPLCGKSVHSSLAQAHVERCAPPPAREEISPPLSCLAAAAVPPCSGLGAGLVAASVSPSGQGEAEGKSSGERWADTSPPSQPTTAPAKPSPAAATTPSTTVRSVTSNTSNNNTPPAAANAFSTLMAASALSNFREEMYLWAHEDGTFSWGWGTAGSPLPPPPSTNTAVSSATAKTSNAAGGTGSNSGRSGGHRSWSCQVATKGPDGRKAGACDLWTNLPPADPAASEGSENAGFAAARPGQSLSRLPVAVVKSMLQKNVRRGRAEAAVRCALELALRSWSDAIRRVLVIVVEDSLLHPAAPLLTWLMVATSKGYRPPPCLLEAFLCVVHETAACPVRDSTDSCRRRHRRFRSHREKSAFSPGTAVADQQEQQQLVETKSFAADEFAVPHPKSLLVPSSCRGGDDAVGGCAGGSAAAADAAVANIRRALLMRVSYGGMSCDQALLKGACLAWGERCGHSQDCGLCGAACVPACSPAHAVTGTGSGSGSGGCPGGEEASDPNQVAALATGPLSTRRQHPPDPPRWPDDPSTSPGGSECRFERASGGGGGVGVPPFGFTHESVLSALQGSGWTAFLSAAHGATGMPPALRSQLMAHVARRDTGDARKGDGRGITPSHHATHDEAARNSKSTATNASTPPTPTPTRVGPILREADAILSGVDFHCSGVLDELLRSTAVSARVGEAIHRRTKKAGSFRKADSSAAVSVEVVGQEHKEGSARATASPGGGVVSSDEEEVIGVKQAAKQAMWACSGGVNFRRLGVAFSSRREEIYPDDGGGHYPRGEGQATCGCCGGCWSSPGFLEELPGVRVGAFGGDGAVVAVGADGGEEVAASADRNTRVWAAISADVLAWTRRFVKGRLARG